MTEANIWGGETPKEPILKQAESTVNPPVPESGQKKDFVLSDDRSGHYVPDAYEKMMQRMAPKEPLKMVEPLDLPPKIEKSPTPLEKQSQKPAEPERVGGTEKYRELLEKGRMAVTQNESSLYFVIAPKDWGSLKCYPAGKNTYGENIFEVTENNVTIGFSDHDIVEALNDSPEIKYN